MTPAKSLPDIDKIAKVVTEPVPRWLAVDDEMVAHVAKVLRTESMSQLGKDDQAISRFERAWADYCGAAYALATNGGTSALAMAVGACAGPGDEVVTTTYTWNATALAIIHANAVPVFADIDPRTFTIDPASVERLVTPRTKAVIAVHLFGHPADMDPLMELARKHGLTVIEDCAQAHGATYKGRRVGALGHIGCFSFQGSKNLAAGEGGMLLTNDLDIYRRAVTVGAHPVRQRQEMPPEEAARLHVGEFCENYRMHPLAAAILEAQLPKLDRYNAMRRRNALALYERIRDIPGIEPGYVSPEVEHVFHLIPFSYRADALGGTPREIFLKVAQAKGVPLGTYVGTPLHLRTRVLEHSYYGKGCPWECPFGNPPRKQTAGACPVAERRCAESELTMYGACFYTECDALLDQIARALRETSEEAPLYASAMRAKPHGA